MLDQLWLNAIAIMPIALLAACVARWLPCRPATRHAMWVTVLLMFCVPSVLIAAGAGRWTELLSTQVSSLDNASSPAPSSSSTLPPEPDGANAAREPQASEIRADVVGAELRETDPVRPSHEEQRDPVRSDHDAIDARVLKQVESWVRPTDNEAAAPLERAAPRAADESSVMSVPESTSPVIAEAVAGSDWMARLRDLRDAAASLPPMSAAIWLWGIAAVLLLLMWRMAQMSRVLRQAEPAPRDVLALVEEAARIMGVSRVPRVFMTHRRISPMLWCGRTTKLVLPHTLWSQLDATGRFAIVCHELAHLKRRDHWVCWGEMMIGVIYWWHPVLWWLRRRIREEADSCCDIWVTHLLPANRRSYAEALLDARKYLSAVPCAGPVVGLGAAARSKSFARRLTMVMTQQLSPRLSVRGIALTLSLAAIGCLVAPITACPPEEKGASTPATTTTTRAVEVPAMPAAPAPPRAVTVSPAGIPAPAAPATTTFERHMESVPMPAEGDDLDARMQRLEQRMDALMRAVESLLNRGGPGAPTQSPPPPGGRGAAGVAPSRPTHPGGGGGAPPFPGGGGGSGAAAPAFPGGGGGAGAPPFPGGGGARGTTAPGGRGTSAGGALPGATGEIVTYQGSAAGAADSPGISYYNGTSSVRGVRIAGHPHTAEPVDAVVEDSTTLIRRYYLPDGKLEEMNDLMERQDVPILVDPQDEYIEVHATASDHRVFKAFCDMIHPDGVLVEQVGGAPTETPEAPATRRAPAGGVGGGGAR